MSNELIIKIEANQTNGMRVSELRLDGSNITIDWGDSTIDDYSESTESIEYEYDEEGEYTITITGVSEIQNGLLDAIRNVVEVIIPNNITSLPTNVFKGCSNLEKVVLPNGISSIGYGFCYDCPNLVELNLPDGLEDIGAYFLYGCGLDEVVFPYGLSTIRTGALLGSNVSNVVIPKSVTSIEDYAFQDCQNLSYIEIPNSVKSIGALFGKGSSLTTIKFCSETPPTMGVGLVNGNFDCSFHVPEGSHVNYMNTAGYPPTPKRYVEYPTLKYKLETLGKLMASNLAKQFVSASWDEGLTTLANKVSDIQDFNDIFDFDSSNDYARYGFRMTWSSIIETSNPSYFTLKVPSTITTLGDASFYCFSSMRICEIPSSVTSIGNNVFSSTNKLEKIIFRGTTPPTVTSSSFMTNDSQASVNIPTTCVIEVPCSALSAYKSATNYPDPTVYTYQCIRFDEKCDSSPVNSNISSPILVYGSAMNGVQSIVYNSQENAYELSGSGADHVIFPINGLSGITNIELSCEVKIPYPLGGVWIGLGVTPPESGTGQTINDTSADVVYVRALNGDGMTSCVYKKSRTSTTTPFPTTVYRSNTGWMRIILNFTSSDTLTARVEELDGTELATFSETVSSQVSDRHYGIYYRDDGDTSVKTYIRNIKCIGY